VKEQGAAAALPTWQKKPPCRLPQGLSSSDRNGNCPNRHYFWLFIVTAKKRSFKRQFMCAERIGHLTFWYLVFNTLNAVQRANIRFGIGRSFFFSSNYFSLKAAIVTNYSQYYYFKNCNFTFS